MEYNLFLQVLRMNRGWLLAPVTAISYKGEFDEHSIRLLLHYLVGCGLSGPPDLTTIDITADNHLPSLEIGGWSHTPDSNPP